MNKGWNPVELKKLCCDTIIKEIYNSDQGIFLIRLKKNYNVPPTIQKQILERYKFIKFICNHKDDVNFPK